MKITKKALAAIMAATMAASAASLTGCSCSAEREVNLNPSEAQRYELDEIDGEQIRVINSGYTLTTDASTDAEGAEQVLATVDYAFIVENPNSGFVAQNVPFVITGYGEDGSVLFTGGANCQYIYPGIQTAVSGTTSVILSGEALEAVVNRPDATHTSGNAAAGNVASSTNAINIGEVVIEPSAEVIDWMAIGMTDDEVGSLFQVSNESAVPGDDGVTVKASITGNIHDGDKIFSTTILQDTLEGHAITIFYDAQGNIVYGSGATNIILDEASEIMAELEGSNENYDVTLANVPEYSSFEIFVMPGL